VARQDRLQPLEHRRQRLGVVRGERLQSGVETPADEYLDRRKDALAVGRERRPAAIGEGYLRLWPATATSRPWPPPR
jgi:hypothetical protein